MPPRILSMDPGKKNFAWALREGDLLEVGWVHPIESVNDDLAFLCSCYELLTLTKSDFVVLERFMVRGGGGQSVLAEPINQMIGRLAVLTPLVAGVQLVQVTPAQWKNWWTKNRGKESWHEAYAHVPSIHQRDACGIGEYLQTHWIPKNV